MLLKQIDYFLPVVDNESFTKAAEKCGVSQSAISQQIGALENRLDTKLLDRHNRTFTLTKAGEYFYESATVIRDQVNEMLKKTIAIGREATE